MTSLKHTINNSLKGWWISALGIYHIKFAYTPVGYPPTAIRVNYEYYHRGYRRVHRIEHIIKKSATAIWSVKSINGNIAKFTSNPTFLKRIEVNEELGEMLKTSDEDNQVFIYDIIRESANREN